MPQATLRKAAECDALTPAVVKRAKAITDKICMGHPAMDYQRIFEQRLEQTLKAQGHDAKAFSENASLIPSIYGLDYLNCSTPLHHLPAALKKRSDCRICLYGPPGTGKTTFGHWLAQETDRPIHVKKASDLLEPYLGQTERRGPPHFEQADDEKAILLIDEVDGFLQDRREAQRSWEIQQVNELLTQMERFRGTFIASTNLMDGIEPAALRRFDLKLKIDYMKGSQLEQLLASFCRELELGPLQEADRRTIIALTNATPGDFANCRRQASFRNFQSPAEFVQAVAEECRMKADKGGRRLGFAS